MAVNDMTFNQLATVLASITSQATGAAAITPTNTSTFVSVANTALKTGYDPLSTAVSQVLSKTIFSTRPYNRKFSGLYVSEQQYGNHVRKLSVIDKAFSEDDRIKLADGASIDQQVVSKPAVLQTNLYGENVYQKELTIYKDQLDCAFSSPDEFARFISMTMQNVSDMIEQAHENTARATVANFIGGKMASAGSGHYVYLISEYNAQFGKTYTATTIYDPEVFPHFIAWAYSRVRSVCNMMTERTQLYHTNVTNKAVSRHTPYDRMRAYFYTPTKELINTSVLSSIFHDDKFKMVDGEEVNFWQAANTPDTINVTAGYLKTDGTVATKAVNQGKIFGVVMDEEAAGVTTVNQWTANAPFNARGGYTNTFWHFTDRYWNDFTENGVVFLLDVAPSS